MPPTTLYELRCDLRAERPAGGAQPRIAVDAELLCVRDGALAWSQLVAAGATGWSAKAGTTFDERAWSWLWGDDDDWAEHPSRLPDEAPRRSWGQLIALGLGRAIDDHVLDELLIRHAAAANTSVRLTFRALDEVAARLPVETLVWRRAAGEPHERVRPLVSEEARRVSIVRVPDRLAAGATLTPVPGAKAPGAFGAMLLSAEGRRHDVRLADPIARALEPLGVTAPRPLDRFDDASRSAAAAADLLVVCGHGQGAQGLEVGDAHLDGAALAAGLGSRGVVVLACCGSADPGTGQQSSLSRSLARFGTAIVIGFAGRETALDHVAPFVRALADAMSSALAAERNDAPVTLEDWERAVVHARRAIATAAVVPVMHVHPALLAGRRPSPRSPRPIEVRRPTQVTTVPWYVPGQVACVAIERGVLRVPLPVDIGARVTVTARPGSGTSTVSGEAAIADSHVEEVLMAWGLAGQLHLAVHVDRGNWARRPGHEVVRTWARTSAELSAVIRAVARTARSDVPHEVVGLLDRRVAMEWGAHDAVPRFVDVHDGRSIRRAGTWPGLVVHVQPVQSSTGRAVPQTLRDGPPIGVTDVPLERVAEMLSSADGLPQLVACQLRQLRAAPTVPLTLAKATQVGSSFVAIPSVARLEVRPQDGRVAAADAELPPYDTDSDELGRTATSA